MIRWILRRRAEQMGQTVDDAGWQIRKADELTERCTLPVVSLMPEMVTALRGPGVYVWTIGRDVLYVGSSRRLGSRAFERFHHAVRVHESPDGAQVTLQPMASYDDALQLEALLIERLRPRFNVRGDRKRNRAMCEAAGPAAQMEVMSLFSKRLRQSDA